MNKKLLIPAVVILSMVLVVAASMYVATLNVTANVNEPIQVSSGDGLWYTLNQNLDFGTQGTSAFPGESITLATVYINNLASVNENVYLTLTEDEDWSVTASDGLNVYALDGSATLITSGEHIVVLTATYNGETSGETFDGTLTIGGTLQD